MRNGSPGDVLLGFRPGQRIFIQGGPGENVGLSNLLMDNPGYARGVEFWSSLVPGINSFDYGSLPGDAKLTTFMASTALEPSITAGRTRLIAMPYSEVAELLSRTEFDAAIFQTSPPDAQGRYSFAHSCDMPPIVWPNAHKRIVFFNEQMHSLPLGQSLPGDAVDLAIPINEPLLSPPPNVSRPAAVAGYPTSSPRRAFTPAWPTTPGGAQKNWRASSSPVSSRQRISATGSDRASPHWNTTSRWPAPRSNGWGESATRKHARNESELPSGRATGRRGAHFPAGSG